MIAAAIACYDIAVEAWPRAMAALGTRDGALPPLASYVGDRLRRGPNG